MILKNVEKKEHNSAVFTVAADAAEFEKAVNAAYLKNKKDVYIPGFRKGKAPRQVIEGMYGKEVFYQDAMDDLAPLAYQHGIDEGDLRVVGQPRISDVNVTEEKGCEFSFDVTTYPEVTLGDYKGIEALKTSETVSDETVDNEIRNVQKRNARMVTVERPAEMGDTVNIDFEGFLNGEPFEGGKAEGHALELGSNSFVPGFEDQLVGMSAGEEKDIDITFPENYAENLAGKAVVFHIVCNEVSSPEYPELDDEFAKDVSEFDTFEEYKADIRAGLQKRADDAAETAYKDEIIRKACDNMTAEIPEVMFEEKVDEFLRNYAAQFGMNDPDMTREQLLKLFGMNEETLKFSIRPAAEAQVKTELLLEAVANAESLEPTEEELEAYYAKTAEGVGATAEDVKRYFGEAFLKNELRKEKAMNLIVENAVPKTADELEPEEAAKELKEEFAEEVAEQVVAEAVEQAEEKAE
ncbi:MAG: trigger factor [Oscillospiraceae bacterium]|nr:trigger factor [Oscillospiraceae bacterium]